LDCANIIEIIVHQKAVGTSELFGLTR